MSVGGNIRHIREEKGYSQRELGNMVGVAQSMICQIERGTKALSFQLSVDIAKALECDIKELAGEEA